MKESTKVAAVTGAGLVGGALLGFFLVRRKVLQRCKSKVRRACGKVPLVPDSVCVDMAKGICVGEAQVKTRAAEIRGERLRRGRPVSRANAVAGSFTMATGGGR